MSTSKPYFITDESPRRLRKLLIKNPFLPTLYENLRTNKPLNESIGCLDDDDDALIEFILLQLLTFGLVDKTAKGYEAKYLRIVPPGRWTNEEHHAYIENVLSYTKDIVSKAPHKKVGFGNWTGEISEADFMAFVENQLEAGNSLINKPDGSVKFQFTFIVKQL